MCWYNTISRGSLNDFENTLNLNIFKVISTEQEFACGNVVHMYSFRRTITNIYDRHNFSHCPPVTYNSQRMSMSFHFVTTATHFGGCADLGREKEIWNLPLGCVTVNPSPCKGQFIMATDRYYILRTHTRAEHLSYNFSAHI